MNWGLIVAQVFPGAWTAILVSLDNVGVWSLRTENLDSWYLGQETYVRVVNPEDNTNKTELPIPDNALYCGALKQMQKYDNLCPFLRFTNFASLTSCELILAALSLLSPGPKRYLWLHQSRAMDQSYFSLCCCFCSH